MSTTTIPQQRNGTLSSLNDFQNTELSARFACQTVNKYFCFLFYFSLTDNIESKTWIPIDQHMDNIAPFGTKTSFSDSSVVDATVENKSISVSEDIQSGAVIDISDNSWKSNLSVGSLIDCKDKNNVWFQVT